MDYKSGKGNMNALTRIRVNAGRLVSFIAS